jgi:hypothetical protein
MSNLETEKVRLSEKWRPARFDDVVGQKIAVQWCETECRKKHPKSVIFYGPTGCGKTTLARLYGRSVACLKVPREAASSCGECQACTANPQAVDSAFREIDCRGKGIADINAILDRLRYRALNGSHHVVHSRANYGNACEEQVRLCFNLKLDDDLTMLRALLGGSLESAIGASDRIRRTPDDTQKLLVRILTGLRLQRRKIENTDTLYRGIAEDIRSEFLAIGRQLSVDLGLTVDRFWNEFTSYWDSPVLTSRTDLNRKLVDAHEWLFDREHQSANHLREAEFIRDGTPPKQTSRPHIKTHEGVDSAYMSVNAATHLWDSASFMAQEFGVYLNTRIILRHDRLDILSETTAARLNSALVTRLSDRLFDWTGTEPHWLYAHSRTKEAFSTTVVMHIPADFADFAEDWLFDFFLRKQVGKLPENGVLFRSVSYVEAGKAALHHRRLLRIL